MMLPSCMQPRNSGDKSRQPAAAKQPSALQLPVAQTCHNMLQRMTDDPLQGTDMFLSGTSITRCGGMDQHNHTTCMLKQRQSKQTESNSDGHRQTETCMTGHMASMQCMQADVKRHIVLQTQTI